MVLRRQDVKLMSGYQPKKLAENCAMMNQGLVLRCESMGCGNAIVSQNGRTKPPLLQILWDSSGSNSISIHPA
jgi:hypothetical protein